MKQISSLQIALLFTGSFLGAGFLSGQEILQFFGQFGLWGVLGMVLTIAALLLFSFLALRIARITGNRGFDQIIVQPDNPWLRGFFRIVFLFFLFACMVGMVAGAGALLQQLWGINALVGNCIMTLIVLLVAIAGVSGVLKAFDIVIPLLIGSAVIITICALFLVPITPVVSSPYSDGNPLLGNWFFSAISFISYNMMAGITILVPLSDRMDDQKVFHRGMILGGVCFAVISMGILLPLILFPDVIASSELPMLALAEHIHPALGILYALLLFCGMFTAALSCLFGITARIQAEQGTPVSWKLVVTLCLLSFVGSIFGFKNVVSYVYPVAGYVGFFALIGIAHHHIKLSTSLQEK